MFGLVFAWRISSPDSEPETNQQSALGAEQELADPEESGANQGHVGFVVSRGGAVLAETQGGTGEMVAAGVIFAVLAEVGAGFRVMDSCNREGWIAVEDVDLGSVPSTREGSFHHSVFVIDPGHGLPDLGAVRPAGLTETEVNMDVAARLVDLLESPRDVDWVTGEVVPGSTIPCGGRSRHDPCNRQGPTAAITDWD